MAQVSGSQPRPRLPGTRRALVLAGVTVLMIVSLVAVAVAAVGPAGAKDTSARHGGQVAGTHLASTARRASSARRPSAAYRPTRARRDRATAQIQASGSTSAGATAKRSADSRPRTSCTVVGHIGDSTSVGMVSPTWLPDAAQRLAAQYAAVGVRHLWVDASGGRSIVEEMPGQLNGDIVAQKWRAAGFRGCWVFALGTNDTANVSVGSNIGRMARIQELMGVAHGEPVMWVNTQTELTSGPWSEANMQLWNASLLQACHAYPNMRVFNWADQVQAGWHLPDGIHYTSAGYAIRAHAIARGLASAFPQNGQSKGCVVN